MTQNTFGTIAIALVIFVCGYALGYLTADRAEDVLSQTGNAMSNTASTVGDTLRGNDDVPNVSDPSGVAFTINVENIPEAQRTFLRTMGVEGNEIVVTNAMLACAEAKIGSGRMTEIQNGATPSMSEGIQLMGCL